MSYIVEREKKIILQQASEASAQLKPYQSATLRPTPHIVGPSSILVPPPIPIPIPIISTPTSPRVV